MDRREHGRRRGKRDETRNDLLHAMQTILESGETFSQIGVERLAAETGMSRTRFYMYFEDLGDLLCSAYARVVDEGKEIVAKWWDDDGYIERDRMRPDPWRARPIPRQTHHGCTCRACLRGD